jgi:hypothetical protein
MIFFILVAAGTSALIEAGVMQSPYLISFSFLAIVVAMGYELGLEVGRAAQLSDDLRETEQRMPLRLMQPTWASEFEMWCGMKSGRPTSGGNCSASRTRSDAAKQYLWNGSSIDTCCEC